MPAQKEWKRDALFLTQKRKLIAGKVIDGPFEANIAIASSSRLDLDNGVKMLLDTAREYGLIPDDSPKYLRRLIIEFGQTEHGARLTLTQLSSCAV